MDLFCSFCGQTEEVSGLEELKFNDQLGVLTLVAEIVKEICPELKVSEAPAFL